MAKNLPPPKKNPTPPKYEQVGKNNPPQLKQGYGRTPPIKPSAPKNKFEDYIHARKRTEFMARYPELEKYWKSKKK